MKSLMAATVIAGSMLAAGGALAIPVVGSSSGTFSNLGNCDNSGSSQNCELAVSNTVVRWDGPSEQPPLDNNPSTLTANAVTINTNTNAVGVVIARLTYFNAISNNAPDPTFTWTLVINFTQPNVSGDTEAFSLSVSTPNNPPGDLIQGFTVPDLNNITFTLNGVTVSNLRYAVRDAVVDADADDSSFSAATNTWSNPENNTSILEILADFTANAVPEPTTLALLGAGLVGLGVSGRRRRKA